MKWAILQAYRCATQTWESDLSAPVHSPRESSVTPFQHLMIMPRYALLQQVTAWRNKRIIMIKDQDVMSAFNAAGSPSLANVIIWMSTITGLIKSHKHWHYQEIRYTRSDVMPRNLYQLKILHLFISCLIYLMWKKNLKPLREGMWDQRSKWTLRNYLMKLIKMVGLY